VKTRMLFLLLLSGLVFSPVLAADEAEQWLSDFDASVAVGASRAFAAYESVPLAVDLARQIGSSEFREMGSGEAAELALGLALAMDADMRFGMTLQEAKARSIQAARLISKDRGSGKSGGIEALQKMRLRTRSESDRWRATSLTDPSRKGASGAQGWMHP
jgi:hypothetical protein